MGAAVSTNVENLMIKALASTSSKIIEKTELTTDTSQVISVKNVHGDVHITGNTFTQVATINMKALLRALSTEQARQDLLTQIEQSAKSLASGINLGQYTDASNLMNLLVQTTINMTSLIKQACSIFSQESQQIIINRIKGNVFIQNNVFSQVQNIIANCVEKATSSSAAFQQLTTRLKQDASATSEGISPWILVALAAIFLGLPIAGGVIGGVYVLKFIFPLIFIAGAVLLVLYFTWTYENIAVIGYSQGIEHICGVHPSSSSQVPSAGDAEQLCRQDKTCAGYDWISYTTKGSTTPTAKLYQTISSSCIDQLRKTDPDGSPVTRVPTFFKGVGQPPGSLSSKATSGDVYLDTHSGDWFQLNVQNTWTQRGTFVHAPITVSELPIDWGANYPASAHDKQLFVKFNATNPALFHVAMFRGNHWHDIMTVDGPGLIPNARSPNVSGYKYQQKRSWALYGGIAGIAVGAIGSIFTLYAAKKDGEEVK